ncbi:hypothetical protein JG687_00015252 [Phytophthora cactorum]|uniref:Uncharacterized protein n=1 Tax=Phytophthora cactorum TaxID=29920 RepID=A0A8T1TZC1_9STRA|nr:hypothetical protein JG687_00015252 [Phytophthora cactorum]
MGPTRADRSARGFVNSTAANKYQWIEWVVARNRALSESYVALLVAAGEPTIHTDMSGQFGIMFDESMFFLENYVALFGVYWHDGSKHKQRDDDKENVDFATSVAKLVLAPQRATLLPVNFEMLMFLRANRGYWYVTTVQDVYQRM